MHYSWLSHNVSRLQLCDYCAAAALSLCCVSQVFEECHCVGPPSIHWSLITAPVCFCSSHLCPPLKQVWQEVYIICTKHCLIVTRTCGKTWAGLESLMKNWPSSFKCLNLHQNDFLFCIWAQTTNWVITYINVHGHTGFCIYIPNLNFFFKLFLHKTLNIWAPTNLNPRTTRTTRTTRTFKEILHEKQLQLKWHC